MVLKLLPTHEGALAILKGVTLTRRRRKQAGAIADPKEAYSTLGVFTAVFVACFVTANIVGHDPSAQAPASPGFGETEYFFYWDSWWFYVRRALLVVAAVVGIRMVIKDDVLDSVRPVEFTFLGLMFGGIYGLVSYAMSARQFQTDVSDPSNVVLLVPTIPVVLGLLLLYGVSEELFFRRFVSRAFMRCIPNIVGAAFAAALVYGVYHVSYVAVWWGLQYWNPEVPMASMPMWLLMLATTWGLPLSLLYMWSRSIVPSAVANITFGWVYVSLSILKATGKL